MAILKIAKMGDPVLRARAQEVPDPTVPQIRALVADMVETLADAGGVGLAAPQVHVPLRIVIFHQPREATEPEDAANATDSTDATDAQDTGDSGNNGDPAADQAAPEDDDDLEDDGPGPLFILVNPLIEPLSDEIALDWEACLSVPRMRGVVPRFTRIRYSGLGLDGKPVTFEAEGFHARVVQHECDHLDGILYPQRMTDLRLLGFDDEFDRHPLEFAPADDGDPAPGAAESEAEIAGGAGAAGA